LSKECPFDQVCYQLNIPNNTATTGKGDIFFQIHASTDYRWVGLGQGDTMRGANIFLIYQSANGKNVTLSPRYGVGNEEPLWDPRADVELLEGSGVKDGWMTANVRCGDCDRWAAGVMNFQSDSGDWIAAMRKDDPLMSDDLEESLQQHDEPKSYEWPLNNAKGGDEANPFVAGAATTVTNSDSSSDSQGSKAWVMEHLPKIHGSLATLVFVILFPIGGILIRVANFRGGIWIHVGVQIVAWIAAIGVVASGIRLATTLKLFVRAHPIIGMVLAVLLIGQPVYGIIHHRMFKKMGQRTGWSYAHLTIGRAVIFGGMINGGLGIMLAGDADQKTVIGYSVIAGVLGILYIAAIIWGERRRKRTKMGATGFPPSEDQARLINRGDGQGLAEPQGQEMKPLWLGKERGHDRTSTEYAPLEAGEGYGEPSHSRSHSRAPSPTPSGRYSDRRSVSMDGRARISMT